MPQEALIAPPTVDQIANVKRWLPTDGSVLTNGWDDAMIIDRWTGGIASTVREYWFQLMSNTAGYLDLPDPGGTLPITQIYRQAKEMLAYWDAFLIRNGDIDPARIARPTRVGRIKKRYVNNRPYPVSMFPNVFSPYNPS